MVVFKTTLIAITVILLILNGTIDVESYKERFMINVLLLAYLVYLLFS